jgi:hypothetical protein
MVDNGGAGRPRRTAPLALVRWSLATLIVAGWLGLYSYWIVSGTRPVCQATVTTQAGSPLKATRTCGLPDVASYLYIFGVIALLLLPDAQSISVGGFQFKRLNDAASAALLTRQAIAGDVVEGAEDAPDVLGQLLGRSDQP